MTTAIHLASGQTVSALWNPAAEPFARLVLAHGAGAGMHHRFMAAVAEGLAGRGVSVLRYQFPYMEAGSKRVDSGAVAHEAVRAAVTAARGELPLFAGGKSFGARMTSQAQAVAPLPGVRGLVFFGFPLHPAGKPSVARAQHLPAVQVPMLFLQGTRDALAEMGLVEETVRGLGDFATLVTIPEADHAFHVPASSGRRDGEVLQAMLDRAAGWMRGVIVGSG